MSAAGSIHQELERKNFNELENIAVIRHPLAGSKDDVVQRVAYKAAAEKVGCHSLTIQELWRSTMSSNEQRSPSHNSVPHATLAHPIVFYICFTCDWVLSSCIHHGVTNQGTIYNHHHPAYGRLFISSIAVICDRSWHLYDIQQWLNNLIRSIWEGPCLPSNDRYPVYTTNQRRVTCTQL